MKKIISLILAALIAFSGMWALADEDPTGTWYLTGMRAEGVDYVPAMEGFEMVLTLNADGTAEFIYDVATGAANQGSWTTDGTTVTLMTGADKTAFTCDGTGLWTVAKGYPENGSDPFCYDGRKITVESSPTVLSFTRETPEQKNSLEEAYAADIAAFDGNWVPVRFGISGYYVDAGTFEALGFDIGALGSMTFSISNGKVDIGGVTIPFGLVDGLLFTEIAGEEGSFTIRLLENGCIRVDMPILPVSVICERAA